MRIFACLAGATSLAAASLFPTSAASASTPPLIWQNVTGLGVQCIVQRGPFRNDAELGAALCARVARLASRSAPVPVTVVPLGDPVLIAPGRAALLVHATVEQTRGGRLLAFSIRPFRASSEETTVLFGAAPRAVALRGAELTDPTLDQAIGTALAETLPWQSRPQRPLPLSQ